ncbi:alpha/beta fold hydrolase [Nocardioides koreensis]|uniref:Alpha/beta fold hydrolase n=1 Tax=Nocardioides koreensis TaxID=433651 RepID=A0ABP5LHL0_9ACTN
MQQRLATTRTDHGVQVAYASAGHGRPLLFVGGWLSHLELSWALPAERQMLEGLGQGRTLLRYDRPGCGLSDRTSPVEPSPDSELDAVAAVLVAAGIERTDVVASSLGVPLMVEWAARHPGTVDRLVLYGGWARGADLGTTELREHVIGLVAASWGLGADVLTDIFAPEASAGTRAALSTYQREASSPETAAALLRLCYRIDVTESLGRVRSPTLVVHREQDRAAPLAQAQLIASTVPRARLQVLPGRSHLPFVGDAGLLVGTIRTFLGLPVDVPTTAPSLTPRQREVAGLVADGLTNREIGRRLGIDERSAEGHLERIRLRLGVRSRAQVAAWWVATTHD